MMRNPSMIMNRQIVPFCILLLSGGCGCPGNSEPDSRTEQGKEGAAPAHANAGAGRITMMYKGFEYELPMTPIRDILTRIIRVCKPHDRSWYPDAERSKKRARFLVDTPDLRAVFDYYVGSNTLYRKPWPKPGVPRPLATRRYRPCGTPDADDRQLTNIISTTVATQVGRDPWLRRINRDRYLPKSATQILLDYKGKQDVVPIEPLRGILARAVGREFHFCRAPDKAKILAHVTIESSQEISVFDVFEDHAIIRLRIAGGSTVLGSILISAEHHLDLKEAIDHPHAPKWDRDESESADNIANDVDKVTMIYWRFEYELPITPVADILARIVRVCEPYPGPWISGIASGVFLVDTPDLMASVSFFEHPKFLYHGPLRDRPTRAWDARWTSTRCAVPDSDHSQLMEIISTTYATQVGFAHKPQRHLPGLFLPRNGTRILLDYRGKQYVTAAEPLSGILGRAIQEEVYGCRPPRESRILARGTIESRGTASGFVVLEDYPIIRVRLGGEPYPGGGFWIREEHYAELKKAIEAAAASQGDK